MKQLKYLLFIFSVISCNQEDKSEEPAKEPICYPKKVIMDLEHEENEYGTLSFDYSINSNQQITHIKITEETDNEVYWDIDVSYDDKGNVTQMSDHVFFAPAKVKFEYNSNNKISKASAFNIENKVEYEYELEYNNNRLSRVNYYTYDTGDPQEPFVLSEVFVFAYPTSNSQNPSQVTFFNILADYERVIEYEYDNKKTAWNDISQFWTALLLMAYDDLLEGDFDDNFWLNTNNIIKTTFKDEFGVPTHTYVRSLEFDGKGYPTKETYSGIGSSWNNITQFIYECK